MHSEGIWYHLLASSLGSFTDNSSWFLSSRWEIMDLLPHASLFRRTLCLIKKVGIYPQTLLRHLSLNGASNAFSSHPKFLQNYLNVEKWKWKEVNKDILGVDYLNSILKIFILDNSLPDCNNICRICFLILYLQKEYRIEYFMRLCKLLIPQWWLLSSIQSTHNCKVKICPPHKHWNLPAHKVVYKIFFPFSGKF